MLSENDIVLMGAADAGPMNYLRKLQRHLSSRVVWVDNPRVLETANVQLVVTGTTLGESLDKEIIRWANKANIISVSVIEHWSWYYKRFETKKGLLLPNYIIVNDKRALDEAIDDGLPPSRLIIGGNPVLEDLACTKNFVKFDRDLWCKERNIPYNARLIIFISEALANDFKKGTPDYLGYDEFEVLVQLIRFMTADDHLIIKLHPSENADKYSFLIGQSITIIFRISVFELAQLADLIIGMGSMLLLELAMLRLDVISFQPNAVKPFIGNTIKATLPASSIDDIQKIVFNRAKASTLFREQFIGSGAKISKILRDIQL